MTKNQYSKENWDLIISSARIQLLKWNAIHLIWKSTPEIPTVHCLKTGNVCSWLYHYRKSFITEKTHSWINIVAIEYKFEKINARLDSTGVIFETEVFLQNKQVENYPFSWNILSINMMMLSKSFHRYYAHDNNRE